MKARQFLAAIPPAGWGQEKQQRGFHQSKKQQNLSFHKASVLKLDKRKHQKAQQIKGSSILTSILTSLRSQTEPVQVLVAPYICLCVFGHHVIMSSCSLLVWKTLTHPPSLRSNTTTTRESCSYPTKQALLFFLSSSSLILLLWTLLNYLPMTSGVLQSPDF